MSGLEFLLDTNILSEPLRPYPNQSVMHKIWENQQKIATASVVYHEMYYGMASLTVSRRRSMIEAYLRDEVLAKLPILGYSTEAAQWHATERACLKQLGKTPPFVDGQIAAIAAVNDLVLITRNQSDYQEFRGLKIENWFLEN